jgi:hypothetical protein
MLWVALLTVWRGERLLTVGLLLLSATGCGQPTKATPAHTQAADAGASKGRSVMSLHSILQTRVPPRPVIIFSHMPAPEDTVLGIQDYVRDGESFIPIFDSADALRSAGGSDGKPAFEIDRALFVSVLKGTETLILNPSLPSELRFHASDLQRAFPSSRPP